MRNSAVGRVWRPAAGVDARPTRPSHAKLTQVPPKRLSTRAARGVRPGVRPTKHKLLQYSLKNGGRLVAALRALMRVFSYLFHGLLTLFLLGLALVALSSGQPLQLEMLPWQGQPLSWWLLGGALAGLASVMLAIRRKWRGLFFIWSLAVLVIIVRGFFFSRYYFTGPPEFHRALYLTAAALVALFGAWFQLRREPLR
jgi:hypothetical protein